MKRQFAFLQLVLFGGKAGIVFKDAAEMGLIVKARLVGNIGKRARVAMHQLYRRAEFFMDHEFFGRNPKQSPGFAVQLAR